MTRITTIVSLCQAGESLYDLFDKVAVIYEGRMAYFGPARGAFDYFVEMGYKPAHRQTTADFLVAVTDPNARISHTGATSIPRTAQLTCPISAITFPTFLWFAEIPELFNHKRIVHRQRKAALYHTFTEAVALTYQG